MNAACPSCSRPLAPADPRIDRIGQIRFCGYDCRVEWHQRHDRRTRRVPVLMDRRAA